MIRTSAGRPTISAVVALVLTLTGACATDDRVAARGATTAPTIDTPPAASRVAPALRRAPWPVTECGTYSGTGCAPTEQRVDVGRPVFSNPTQITNPLFPISELASVVLLGEVDGMPFRAETTLLPETGVVVWDGEEIEVLLSQYVAYLDGEIQEVAIDRYAQADDGAVWYLGEDVYDYENGAVAVSEGTWLVGRDGPPAMIMPAAPTVGDVFRPENIPGIIFEEVQVKAVDQTVDGPHGPVQGALVAEELHLDGANSEKIFAPGYGEFYTASDGEVEALAVAVPADAIEEPEPPELAELSTAAWGIVESARLEDWDAVSPTLGRMQADWGALRDGEIPPLVADNVDRAFTSLAKAVRDRRPGRVVRAAIDVALGALDVELLYGPARDVDVARFHLHTQRLRALAAASDLGGVTGEVAALEWIYQRIGQAIPPAERQGIETRLRDLRTAADAQNLASAADHAARLAAEVRRVATS